MATYNKDEIKERLTTDQVFDIVYEFGGEPTMTNFGFISATICHNHPGEGSHKLYYYENTKLFRCYTGCDSYFDIFELIQKIQQLKGIKDWSLYNSMKWVASRYGWSATQMEIDEIALADWKILDKYEQLQETVITKKDSYLKEYDPSILAHLCYPRILHWEKEGITDEVIKRNLIGYYPANEQITIPHFDINGRFIGLRGRALGKEEGELYGKYRPIQTGSTMYNHPLGLNLYNLNNSKNNIKILEKAIIFEGEKSVLKYQSYFGFENDISVACCGSSISQYQINLLLQCGAKEIIVALDKQFQKVGDDEFKHLTRNLKAIHSKYDQYATISFIFDKGHILDYKDSPIDKSKEDFLFLFKNRIFLK